MKRKFHSFGNLQNIYQFGVHEVKSQHVKQFSLVNSKTYRNERHQSQTYLHLNLFRFQIIWTQVILLWALLWDTGQISAQALCIRSVLLFSVWSHSHMKCHTVLLLASHFFCLNVHQKINTTKLRQSGKQRKRERFLPI